MSETSPVSEASAQDQKIPVRDRYALAGTVFQPLDVPARRAVIINNATAIPRRFYRHFAARLPVPATWSSATTTAAPAIPARRGSAVSAPACGTGGFWTWRAWSTGPTAS